MLRFKNGAKKWLKFTQISSFWIFGSSDKYKKDLQKIRREGSGKELSSADRFSNFSCGLIKSHRRNHVIFAPCVYRMNHSTEPPCVFTIFLLRCFKLPMHSKRRKWSRPFSSKKKTPTKRHFKMVFTVIDYRSVGFRFSRLFLRVYFDQSDQCLLQ